MARQLTVGSRSARMCLRAVTDTRAEQEGLGVRGLWGRVGAVQEGEGGGPGGQQLVEGEPAYFRAWDRALRGSERRGWGSSSPGPAQGGPTHFPRLGSALLSPGRRGSLGLRAAAAAGTRWHHGSPPGRVAGLGEGRGGGGVGDTGQPPRQKEGSRSPRVPPNDKPPRQRPPMVTAVSPLALISEPPQPRLRDRQQAQACTDLRGPRPSPWPPQRPGSG